MKLHILNRRPISEDFTWALQAEDNILLTQDAVYLALDNDFVTLKASTFFCLEEDIKARGLSDLLHEQITKQTTKQTDTPIQLCTYAGFVKLTEEHSSNVSW